jgi:two-component system, LytTR family, sensor kinase
LDGSSLEGSPALRDGCQAPATNGATLRQTREIVDQRQSTDDPLTWEMSPMTACVNQKPKRSILGRSLKVRRERGTIVALIVIFWLAFQVLFFTYGSLAGNDEAIDPGRMLHGLLLYLAKPVELAIVAAGAGLSLAIYLLLCAIRRQPLWRQLLTAAAAAIGCGACFSFAVSTLCDLFDVAWPAMTPRFLIVDTLRWFAPFCLWAAITLTVTYNSEMRERERRLAELQARAQDAQMRALRYQVNPHLLYNTLNSIAALILDRQNDVAEAMVIRLSNFFRSSLSNDPHSDVPLAEEVALQRLYLEIEQMRFPQLITRFDIPQELSHVRVPSLILQPLVENALKHGINPNGVPTNLTVRARGTIERIVLEIDDDGPGTSTSSGTGVGLENVRARLVSRFGDGAMIETESEPGLGHMVRLSFPVGHA